MRSAARHYKLFVDSFRCEESGALPDRVEPDMEQHFLSGMFSMARMLQGLPGTGTIGSSAAAAPDNCRWVLGGCEWPHPADAGTRHGRK